MEKFYNPVRTVVGRGALEQLPALAEAALPVGGRILLLLWQGALAEMPSFVALRERFGQRLEVRIFPASNPTLTQLHALWRETRDLGIGLVIAVGGGSTLDMGKSLCCLYGHDFADAQAVRQFIAGAGAVQPQCRWIGVPTTSGTGSEVTCWATVWDPEQGAKRSLSSAANYAYAAVVDPELTRSMPVSLAVSSALDALAHATESYWARATNAQSRILALAAIRRIRTSLEGLFVPAEAETARLALAEGSLLAGLAFSNTRTTACHAISYPLTLHHGLPHGVAVALLLGPVMALNAQAVDLTEVLAAYALPSPKAVQAWVSSVLERSGSSATLRGWGVPERALAAVADQSFTKGRADNNPVDLSSTQVLELLRGIL
ncbi:MAG: phosphonoacetaldehyde reductase [Candidatus Spyradenecus sp.]